MPQIDKEWVTLIAAICAALFALIGVVLNIVNAHVLYRREALRRILENELNNISKCLYCIVAFSKKMSTAKQPAAFSNFRKLADEQRIELNKIRNRVSYSLWGLDYGLMAIRSIPLYMSHYNTMRPDSRADELIRLGTKLRLALDRAILSTYLSGLPPTALHRLRVKLAAWQLHRSFAKGRPKHEHA